MSTANKENQIKFHKVNNQLQNKLKEYIKYISKI